MFNDKFRKSVDIAKEMIEVGGEIHRAEESIKRINGDAVIAFALPSLIIAQNGNLIQARKINNGEIDLTRLAVLNKLSREMSDESAEFYNYDGNYGQLITTVAYFGATAGFCLYFGGGIIDALFAGIIGLMLSLPFYSRIILPDFSICLIKSFLAGIMAHLPSLIGFNASEGKIIIGAIMLLVPGLTVVNAARDIMNYDIIAGMIEFANAVISALAIALGISGALFLSSIL